MKAGILNVTGYAGVELARILYNHPGIKLSSVTGRSAAGKKLGEVFPHLSGIDLTITAELDDVDIAFSALTHGASAEALLPLIKKGIKVIDISADFRLKDAAEYEKWYNIKHAAPELLKEAVYGLVELNRKKIPSSRIVANPGCYPTSAILAMAPALKEGLIDPGIIVDSKSGVSGAGRTLTMQTHYSEVNENVSAYALEGHRHLPEISQELRVYASDVSVLFVPHLIPMTRGILSTCYGSLKKDISTKTLVELYKSFYAGEKFVKVVNEPPQTKQTWGSNLCLIHPVVDARTGRIVVISCIDNLVKGAAGQAIQNMNLMLGLPESMGLDSLPVYP
ncbi:MAG: N-acetyl-gamma-glutamyl-phosphate reductase [Chloroflexi bacterium]|nr:N-acetyl-gamma-glutamyl-phosphate reductase [Chloroflexota bacterium]